MNDTMNDIKIASPKQLKWLKDLLTERDFSAFPADWVAVCERLIILFARCITEGYEAASLNVYLAANDGQPLTHDDFQRLLVKLQAAPKNNPTAAILGATVSAEQVPEGRYAVPTEEGALNKLAFYKVGRPTEGRWAGFVFVKLMLSDQEQRMSKATGDVVLAKIAAVGAKNASAAYGLEFKHCGVCGRGLTNDESRKIGIGPDCRAKMGW